MPLFGVTQQLYTLFSSSTEQWKIFKDRVEGLTFKPLSQTRWDSHVESVKSIKEHTLKIRDVLIDLTDTSEDPKTKSEAKSLATNELENFKFLLSIVIWYKLLHAIKIVSKLLKVKNMDIDVAITRLKGLILTFEDYRKFGFGNTMMEVKQMESEMGIEVVF